MPNLALVACTILVVWLIALDIKRRPSVSFAVWIPITFLLILASRPVSLWVAGAKAITHEMGNEVAGSPVDQIFYLSVYLTALGVTLLRGFKWSRFFVFNLPVLSIYLYFAASILWSGDPAGSFKRLIKDFGMWALIALLFSEKNPLQAIRAVYVRCACILFPFSVVTIKYFPEISRVFALNGDITVTGLATQKNSLGEMVLIFSLFVVWDVLERVEVGTKLMWGRVRWDSILVLSVGMWLLHQSQSKTALVCLAIGTFLIVRRGWLDSRLIDRVALGMGLSSPFLLFFSQQFSSVIAPLVEALGRNMTFTGRANIWERITLTTVNPLLGAGYWNFWGGPGGAAIAEAMHTGIPNAHNGYLDLYIDGGFLGLIVLFSMLLLCGRRILKRARDTNAAKNYRLVSFAVLIVALIYSLSESTFVRLMPIWFTTLLMIIEAPVSLFPKKRRPIQRERLAATAPSGTLVVDQ